MAGGLGKRMNSSLPKVLHKVGDKPMICHILKNALSLNYKISKILIVVGKYKDEIKAEIERYITVASSLIKYVDQATPMGTGHAIQCCVSELVKSPEANVLILSGDVPLLSTSTMNKVLENSNGAKIVVTNMSDPTGYGRIQLKDNKFERIIEQKDCDDQEREITLVNCGIYAIHSQFLCKYLQFLTNNNSQKEYYLTDIIEIIKNQEKMEIQLFLIETSQQYEIMGVNTVEQLKQLEEIYLYMLL
jgi:UDP-N-acetylglucosamine diphosphorylase/glucosamine-1-phosphate N-acetyltransferase